MSSPLVAGNLGIAEEIVQAGLNGSDVHLLHVGDSIAHTMIGSILQTWRPYRFAGYFTPGEYFGNAAPDHGTYALTYGMNAGSIISASTNVDYSLFGTFEWKSDGAAFAADASFNTCRLCQCNAEFFSGQSRSTFTFGGADLLNGQTVNAQALFYSDTNSYASTRFQVVDQTASSTVGGSPITVALGVSAPTYTLSPAVSWTGNTNFYTSVVRAPSGVTIPNNKTFALLGVRTRVVNPGLVYYPAANTGKWVGCFNPGDVDAAILSSGFNGCIDAFPYTHVMISLTQNQPGGGYTGPQYTTAMNSLIAALRARLPASRIILAPSWDGSDSFANPQNTIFTDACAAIAKATPGCLFLNGYAAMGTKAQSNAIPYCDAGNVHPKNAAAYSWVAGQWWNLMELAAGAGRFTTLSSGAHLIRRRR